MREILFRGKDTSGKWHYGVPLMFNEDYVCIAKLNEHNKTVEYKTLGQYTGLTDKNGTKIFEGDIVITKTTSYKFVGCILYSTEYVRFVCVTKSKMPYPMDSTFEYEVIGNIHDNPELLEA